MHILDQCTKTFRMSSRLHCNICFIFQILILLNLVSLIVALLNKMSTEQVLPRRTKQGITGQTSSLMKLCSSVE